MNASIQPLVAASAPSAAVAMRGGIEVAHGLAPEWAALCGETAVDEPFYRPDWIAAYLAAFAADPSLVVATARRSGKLAAILPLVRELGTLGGLPARKLRSAGNTHTCRCELVHARLDADDAAAEIWRVLRQERGWDVLEIENAPAGGTLMRLLDRAAADGYRTSVVPVLAPPYLDLSAFAGDFEKLLATLDAKFRSNLRRRMRKLEQHGKVALVSSAESAGRLDAFYALERAGWKGAEGSAIACDAATRAFYDGVAHSAERRGTLRWYALELDGRAVAMFFGLYDGGRYYLLKTAYDEELRECSPGQLLASLALQDLVAGGAVEFDFLGGGMEWKRDWTRAERQLYDLRVFCGPAGAALHALCCGLRPALGRALRKLGAVR